MSGNWDPSHSGNGGIMHDPLYLGFPTCTNDTHLSDEQLSQLLFNSTNDYATAVSTTTWWTPENPNSSPGKAVGQDQVGFQPVLEDQVAQEPEKDINHAVSELQHQTGQLAERMENGFAEVDEKFTTIHNGLEEQTARFCSEIDAHIKSLKAWATHVKMLIDKAAELQDLQQR